MSTSPTRRAALRRAERRALKSTRALSPETVDAIVYAVGAIFALITIFASDQALYRQWAELAIGPFIFGAVAGAVLAYVARRRNKHAAATDPDTPAAPPTRRSWMFRIGLAILVFAGATAIPLGLEILWRHAQPEVAVIQRAGQDLAKGKDPYHPVTDSKGKVKYHQPHVSTVDSFDPYLPIMDAFGIPSGRGRNPQLTDARIFFSVATLGVAALALWLSRADARHKMRAIQVIAILPTAALPLATGGDDMPVVAFLLLAMVLAQRSQPFASGLVLGIVSAMKFTAWPLAGLALFAARNKRGQRRPDLMLFGILLVAVPVVAPYIVRGPWAFFDNVVLFPLGLSGVTSPAASPLPGHLIVSAFPWLHRALPVTVGFVGGAVLALYLWRRPPQSVADVCRLGGVVMAVATLVAPATRIGYLLYPINFFVWAYLFAEADVALPHIDEPPRSKHLIASAPT
jgi:hypothetical protein